MSVILILQNSSGVNKTVQLSPQEFGVLPKICSANEDWFLKSVNIYEHGIKNESNLQQRQRNRRAIDIEQHINNEEYVQVIRDGAEIELTVRVNRKNVQSKRQNTPPISTSTSTTTTSAPLTNKILNLAKALNRITFPASTSAPTISEECEEYRFLLDQTVSWGINEISKIENFESDNNVCRSALPASHPTRGGEYLFSFMRIFIYHWRKLWLGD